MAKRRQLDTALVVTRAAALADAAGTVESLTLTELAADLDVKVPSLYNHIDGVSGLRRELSAYAARLLLKRLRAATAGKVRREAVFAMADAYRCFATEHPGIYPLTVVAPEPGDETMSALAQELLQLLLLILGSLGLAGRDALHVVRGLRSCLHGFVALESAGGFKMALDLDESFRRMLTAYLDGVVPSASVLS